MQISTLIGCLGTLLLLGTTIICYWHCQLLCRRAKAALEKVWNWFALHPDLNITSSPEGMSILENAIDTHRKCLRWVFFRLYPALYLALDLLQDILEGCTDDHHPPDGAKQGNLSNGILFFIERLYVHWLRSLESSLMWSYEQK